MMARASSLHNSSDTSKLDVFEGGESDRAMLLLMQASRGLCLAKEIAEMERMTTKKTMEVFIIASSLSLVL